MSVSEIHERQIVAVIQHMNLEVTSTFGNLSDLAENQVARLIAIANQEAYDARYSHLEDPYKHQRVDVEFWKGFNFSFPTSTYKPVSHFQCLKYLDDIIYNCGGSPNWDISPVNKILTEWHGCLLQEIFKDVSHLAPK